MIATQADLAVILIGVVGALVIGGFVSLRDRRRPSDAVWPPEPPAGSVPVQLSRGSVVMSRASYDALSPKMRAQIEQSTDIIVAENALRELDGE